MFAFYFVPFSLIGDASHRKDFILEFDPSSG